MTDPADYKENIEKIITSRFHSGLFTHCFFELGFLDHPAPFCRLSFAKELDKKVFDLASLTKPLVTAALVFRLLERLPENEASNLKIGDISSCSPLADSLKNIRILDLLSHCSGLPAWRNFWIERLDAQATALDKDRQIHMERVFLRYHWDLQDKSERYSDVGYILLGYILEKYYGMGIDQLFEHYKDELGILADIAYPSRALWSKEQYITSAYCPVRQRWLSGEVHDENAASLGGICGHAGLFSSGSGLSKFLRALSASNYWKTNLGGENLLGMRPSNDDVSRIFSGPKGFGHWGFTGTAFWYEPETKAYLILLTNRVISGRLSKDNTFFRKSLFEQARAWTKYESKIL